MKTKEELFNLNEPQEKYLTEQDVRTLFSSMLLNWTENGRIKKGYLQSSNYTGSDGWKLDSNGATTINDLTLGTLTGIIKATSGTISAITDNSANWDTAYTHSQIAGGDSVHVSTTENTNWDSAYTHSQIAGGDSVHVSVTENSNWDSAYGWGNHASAGYAILAGQSGGQTLQGGTASGEDLYLESTANATKGTIFSKDNHEFQTTATFDAIVDNGNSGTADTIDWTAGNKQKITTTGSCTLTFTAPANPCSLQLKIIHENSASAYTYTWPATVKWPSGTAITTTNTANAVDIVSFLYDGTNYYAVGNTNFS